MILSLVGCSSLRKNTIITLRESEILETEYWPVESKMAIAQWNGGCGIIQYL